MILVVSGLIVRSDRKILLAQQVKDGLYTTPGGKVDSSDATLMDALRREVKEETDLNFSVGVYIGYREPPGLLIHFFIINNWMGEVINTEPSVHKEWEWLNSIPENSVLGLLLIGDVV